MSEYFENLNSAKNFAGDFHQEPRKYPVLAAGRAEFVRLRVAIGCDRPARRGNPPTAGRINPARNAANKRFTQIRHDTCNTDRTAAPANTVYEQARPFLSAKNQIDRMHSFKTIPPGLFIGRPETELRPVPSSLTAVEQGSAQ